MKKQKYNPEIHHRRSIRLKGHDYAGGGLYFVTICAHREFIAAAKGQPFGVGARCISPGGNRATCMSPVRKIVQAEWAKTAELRPYAKLGAHVIMPDHFHALIRLEGGHAPLGDVVGGIQGGSESAN